MPEPADEHRAPDPALDETVADEEVEMPPESPVEGTGGGTGAPAPLRPLPPRFREESPPFAGDRAGRPAEAERPAARTRGAPARQPGPGERDRRWREDLGDTPSLEESRAGGAMSSEELGRVEVEDIFDRSEQQSTASAAPYDPEAGRTNVAVKIQAASQVVRSAASTPFGKLVLAIPVGLAAITLTILAIVDQTLWICIAAGIVVPIAGWLLYARYQAWLGHKRYMYRLLETLGEDVSDFDSGQTFRRIGKSMNRRRP
jgi:hypothetical protein